MQDYQATPEELRCAGAWLDDVFGPGSVKDAPIRKDGK